MVLTTLPALPQSVWGKYIYIYIHIFNYINMCVHTSLHLFFIWFNVPAWKYESLNRKWNIIHAILSVETYKPLPFDLTKMAAFSFLTQPTMRASQSESEWGMTSWAALLFLLLLLFGLIPLRCGILCPDWSEGVDQLLNKYRCKSQGFFLLMPRVLTCYGFYSNGCFTEDGRHSTWSKSKIIAEFINQESVLGF